MAPFRYHSVRSLGFLLFAICHLQNRLRCKFNDAVFEHASKLRVSNPDDTERRSVNLVDKGVIDNSVDFVKAQDRWSINQGVVESGLAHNQQVMGGNAVAFVQNYATGVEKQKTATQVMAEQNSATALVNAALLQAYAYQVFQYREIARRFCIKNSRDADVRKFRVRCLKANVPEYALRGELGHHAGARGGRGQQDDGDGDCGQAHGGAESLRPGAAAGDPSPLHSFQYG
jgi:hypothetical protein